LVMRPHPDDLDDSLVPQDLIHKTMLKVDPARISSGQIAEQFLVRRRTPEGIFSKDFEERLHFRPESGSIHPLRIPSRLPRKDELPPYQSGLFAQALTGVFKPRRID